MISASNSRAAGLLGCLPASFLLLLVVLSAPPCAPARPPQSPSSPTGQQQPIPDPTKKDPTNAAPDSAAPKTNSPKPHRVFTNDDLSSSYGIPIPPGARRRLKQLNRCDRACFNDVKKQAISFGYITAFPRSTREEMDDRLANDIEGLQHDPKWQRLLLEMISAHIDYCATRQNSQPPDNSPPHTPTRAEIVEEEERMRQHRPAPTSNYGAAGSAVMSYRWKMNPDPLRASLMVHQYLDETARNCPLPESTAQPSDVDEDP
jgi:hypothetical protein